MRCPKCTSEETKVIDTRTGKGPASIRRRRECIECTHRFSTMEEILREDLVVIKRDGKREDFDTTKLLKGVRKSLEKRPVEFERIEDLVLQVTTTLQQRFDSEIPSSVIGDEVMNHLKELDQIAYVRFASIYKEFQDISQLAKEIKSLRLSN